MVTRRAFLAATAAPIVFPRNAPAANRRNVLFISIDDLNDWVGCLGGHPQTRTPNLDRLASTGVLFSNAHCAAPLCNPSRAALMFGVRPSTSGVYSNDEPYRKSPVLENALSIPQTLRGAGYKVMGAGKIYHGNYPDPQSWDDYWPSQQRNQPPSPVPAVRPANGIQGTGNVDWAPLDNGDEEMGDYGVADWTIQQLARKTNDPRFLACGIYKPHLPWYVPKKYFDLFPLDSIELPAVNPNDLDDIPPAGVKIASSNKDHQRITGAHAWKAAVRAYLASIAFADAQVGRVLRALETGPNAGAFDIVLWSDHGWHLGEKLHWRKFTLWEEATRNVLMMSIPGMTKPGGRCTRAVNLLDIYPTLTELTGAPKPKTVEGDSLVRFLKNPQAPKDTPTLTTFRRGNHALRDERWRYIRYADGTEELYDHNNDPNEWVNLAPKPEHTPVKQRLAKFFPETNAPASPAGKGTGNEGGHAPISG
ncbi:MAG: sulfatase [Bryobacterales bacterium]|nr:sulfatase [Bryobacterales bacterium]